FRRFFLAWFLVHQGIPRLGGGRTSDPRERPLEDLLSLRRFTKLEEAIGGDRIRLEGGGDPRGTAGKVHGLLPSSLLGGLPGRGARPPDAWLAPIFLRGGLPRLPRGSAAPWPRTPRPRPPSARRWKPRTSWEAPRAPRGRSRRWPCLSRFQRARPRRPAPRSC